MKYLSIAALTALFAVGSFNNASAFPTVELYLGSTLTDQTLTFSKPFTETFFSPSELNSVVSETLTSEIPQIPGQPPSGPEATGDVTINVYLADTITPTAPELVASQNLVLNLSTYTSTTSTTETSNYPSQFYAGPTGTFNELIVDVIGSNIANGGVSFTGFVELEDVPEPSTWAMLIGGLGVLLVAARFRRTARQA